MSLLGKKYFIEVLHKQNGGLAHVHVIWKLPGTDYFRSITHEFISSYMEKHASLPNDIGVLKQHKTSSIKYTFEHYRKLSPSLAESKTRYIREHHHFLPKCNRSALNRNPKRYEGIGFVNTASVYPSDGSSELMLICREPLTTMDCLGTPLLSNERASEIVEKYLKYALPK